jgi:ribosomal protein L19E
VQYAFKKDGKGERHGTAAERLLANQAKWVVRLRFLADSLMGLENTRLYREGLGVDRDSLSKVRLLPPVCR